MRKVMAGMLLIAATGVSGIAHAQSGIDGRVDRLEREMRAVQRKLFPGGYIEPQITDPTGTPAPGVPTDSPLATLEARVNALESTLATMTNQIEQSQFKQRQIEEAFTAYKRTTDARLKALEEGASRVGGTTPPATGTATGGTTKPPVAATRPPATGVKPPPAVTTRPVADPRRSALVAAIERPATGDDAEDDYTYGYRLWQAKLYPEARAALQKVYDKFPKHRRASYARNLHGRALLDDGKASLAAIAFYDSYKKLPDGERAPDSLYYLGQSLVVIKKPAEACDAYAELTEVYGSKIGAQMKADVARARIAARCK